MTTKFIKNDEANAARKWHTIDAAGVPLGRLATEVAALLKGKHKPTYTPNVDSGDFVVVLNASQVALTGAKLDNKLYHHHTGYVGGLKSRSARTLRERKPEEMITKAVWGMLPRGPLGSKIVKKLKVYSGSEHPHTAQNPEQYTLKYVEAGQN